MKNKQNGQKINTSMLNTDPTILIILTVNALNKIKRQILWEFIKKQYLNYRLSVRNIL